MEKRVKRSIATLSHVTPAYCSRNAPIEKSISNVFKKPDQFSAWNTSESTRVPSKSKQIARILLPQQTEAAIVEVSYSESKKNTTSLITFTSWIKDIDVVNAGLDIITLTSKNEGTPVSLIEAQASSKPIVTTNVGFGSVGIGSTLPTAALDVGGHTKFKTYSEAVSSPSIVANEVTLDLSVAQSFTITASDDINAFVLTNPPSGSTSFTVKILQDSTGGRSVGIDTFKNSSGTAIPVYWPGGGVLPIVTTTADRADIYSFKLFDGDNVTSSGLYGVVGGQNFA